MLAPMSWWIERQLRGVGDQLRRARDDLDVAREQLIYLSDDAGDAETRALVSEGGMDRLDATDAGRHRDKMARHIDDIRARIERLEAKQDELLDRLTARKGPTS